MTCEQVSSTGTVGCAASVVVVRPAVDFGYGGENALLSICGVVRHQF